MSDKRSKGTRQLAYSLRFEWPSISRPKQVNKAIETYEPTWELSQKARIPAALFSMLDIISQFESMYIEIPTSQTCKYVTQHDM